MSQPFFITGLPCSRTSWLANLFTTGPVFCHHDLLGRVDGLDGFFEEMSKSKSTSKSTMEGDADSGLIACYVPVWNRFPAAPWVVVQRKFEDAWDSLCAFVASGPWREKLSCTWELQQAMRKQWDEMLPVMTGNPRCMVVPFESLDRTDMIEDIWKHCAPGVRFDRRRAEALQGFTVRPNQGRVNARPQWSLVQEVRKLWPAMQPET